MAPVIEVEQLTKSFREIKAVDALSFSVMPGEVYGFLGQNGAGKSTTIRMLLTLIKPDAGTIRILGMDLQRHRREILRQTGAIIERPDLYKYLTGLENLRIFATLSGVRPGTGRLMEQLDAVGLADRAHSKVKTYSQGMKQRLGIATALVHDPQLVILDEPVNGLDPQGIADIRRLILQLSREQQKTVLVSSHLLHEIELIADSMLIMHKGKKLVEGKVSELFDPAEQVITLTTACPEKDMAVLKESSLAHLVQGKRGEAILLRMHRNEMPGLLRELGNLDISILTFSASHSLEDYFLSLTSAMPHVEATAD